MPADRIRLACHPTLSTPRALLDEARRDQPATLGGAGARSHGILEPNGMCAGQSPDKEEEMT